MVSFANKLAYSSVDNFHSCSKTFFIASCRLLCNHYGLGIFSIFTFPTSIIFIWTDTFNLNNNILYSLSLSSLSFHTCSMVHQTKYYKQCISLIVLAMRNSCHFLNTPGISSIGQESVTSSILVTPHPKRNSCSHLPHV